MSVRQPGSGSALRTLAAVALFTTMGLILLNLALWIIRTPEDASGPQRTQALAEQRFGELRWAYPELDREDVAQLFEESWRPYAYEPYTQFREAPFSGRFVNVSPFGFRHGAGQAAWPPDRERDLVLFLFGGSTAFGYLLADEETIGSRLQHHLGRLLPERRVRVFNFGRGHYYSTQERVLFERLLVQEFVPHLAVFLDGLNEFHYVDGGPQFGEHFEALVAGLSGAADSPTRDEPAASLGDLPMVQAAREAGAALQGDGEDSTFDRPAALDAVIARYLGNRRLIRSAAQAYNVQPVFVWQPVPMYAYDQAHHRFAGQGYGQHTYCRFGYPRMAERVRAEPQARDFLYLADIQRELDQPLYVDPVHYAPTFADRIAAAVAEQIVERGLLAEETP